MATAVPAIRGGDAKRFVAALQQVHSDSDSLRKAASLVFATYGLPKKFDTENKGGR